AADDDTSVSFSYTITDGTDNTAGSATLDITPVNDAPTTSSVVLTAIAEDSGARTITQAELLSAAGDVEGDSLTATTLAISGGSGTLVDNGDGTWDYTPAADDDTSVSFSYTITDGADNTAGTATLDITPVNDSPTLSANSGATVAEGQAGTTITSAMLSGVDVDDSGAGLTFTITDAADNGTLALNGFGVLGLGNTFTQADLGNGDVTYSHDGSETIADAFSFSLADGGEDGAVAISGTFGFTVTPVNDNTIGPVSDIDVSADTVAENSLVGTVVGVTAFASDADASDSVSYWLDDDAGGRFAIDAATGVVSVAGALDFETSSSENITVRATSTDGSNTTQVISISITNVNEAPTATGESFAVGIGQTLSVGVSGVIVNDTDIDGDSLAIVLVTAPSNGTFTLSPGGDFTYAPNPGFFGQDSFFYRVTDGTLSSNLAEVVLEVPIVAPPGAASEATQKVSTPSDPEPETAEEPAAATPSEPEAEAPTESSTASESPGSGSVSAIVDPEARQAGSAEASSDRDVERGMGREIDEIVESERQLYGVYSVAENASSLVLSYSPELQQLERLLRQDLQQAIVWTQWDNAQEQQETPMMVYVGAAGAGMSVFSIGYVFWALRGGALMSVFASSLPAWRFIDPIAMLSAYRSSQSRLDEGLETLLDRRS
ncbi:tandem-95 repeat protein, partial [Stieleria sp.]|uniref:tandem-95 repeat protein n=1 Tax=Stieleria sp. TaxID=2795976 RepID=UPI003566910B